MTLRTRRKIFYTLVALFIILGGGVAFYAQGWRFDFATWNFEKVGGIYVRAYPENASIYLNGKLVQNQSGFLSPGTLISDLLPRSYTVTLKATGYDAWQENATVDPSLVVQFKYAVLVPQKGTMVSSTVVTSIAKQLSGASSTTAVVKNASTTNGIGLVAMVANRSLQVYSLNDPTIDYRFNLPDIADVQQVIWYQDNEHLFIVYPSRVSFLDLTDSGLSNLTTVATGTSPLYDPSTNSLYIKNSLGRYFRYDFSF